MTSSMPTAGPMPVGAFPGGLDGIATLLGRSGRGRFFAGGPSLAMTDARLVSYLEANRGTTRFLVVTPNAMLAAPLILSTGQPVMALGWFMGRDPILTAAQLAARVQSGDARFFLLPGSVAGNGRMLDAFGGELAQDTSWVASHCAVVPTRQWQSSAASGRARIGAGADFGAPLQLYDCGKTASGGRAR